PMTLDATDGPGWLSAWGHVEDHPKVATRPCYPDRAPARRRPHAVSRLPGRRYGEEVRCAHGVTLEAPVGLNSGTSWSGPSAPISGTSRPPRPSASPSRRRCWRGG